MILRERLERKRAFFLENLAEILAFNEGHGDELGALEIVQIVNAQDILVRNSAGKKQFLFEALDDRGVADEIRLKRFERDRAREFLIERSVHLAHAASTEKFFDAKPGAKVLAGLRATTKTGAVGNARKRTGIANQGYRMAHPHSP